MLRFIKSREPDRSANMTDRIEQYLNWLSDKDWGWWPVLNLRPQKNEHINNLTQLKITSIFGTVSGLVIIALLLINKSEVQLIDIPVIWLIGLVLYFFIYKYTFAACWNRRANRSNNNNA